MIWLALSMGFLGSLHCAAMCGPLMLGLSSRNYNWFSNILHHVGRWLGYIVMALVLRILISPVALVEWQQGIGILSGILILLYGLKSFVKPVHRVFESISARLAILMGKTTNPLPLGVLNGLLPCGLSFAAASVSLNYSWDQAMLFMVLFGGATAPILLLITYLPQISRLRALVNGKFLPRMMLLMGLLIIVRSSGLGIPYLSPEYDQHQEKMECCEHN